MIVWITLREAMEHNHRIGLRALASGLAEARSAVTGERMCRTLWTNGSMLMVVSNPEEGGI